MSLVCMSCDYQTPGWDLGPDAGTPAPVEEEAGPAHMLTASLMLFALLVGVVPSFAQNPVITCRADKCTVSQPVETPATAAQTLEQGRLYSNLGLIHFGDNPRPSGDFGRNSPLDFPEPRPARRLDGTLLTDPPTVYGVPAGYVLVPQYQSPHRQYRSRP